MFEKVYHFFVKCTSSENCKERLSNYYVDLFKYGKKGQSMEQYNKDLCFLNCARRQNLNDLEDSGGVLSGYFNNLEGLRTNFSQKQRRI